MVFLVDLVAQMILMLSAPNQKTVVGSITCISLLDNVLFIIFQTSVYSNDSSENVEDTKDNFPTKKLTFITSTTPLEPDKNLPWKSIEDLKQKKEKPKDIDKEFDMFSKERICTKKNPVPLEPNIVVLVPKSNLDCKERNLDTLNEDEEKHEEIQSILSETASSITEFCQTNFLKTELCIREDNLCQDVSVIKDTSNIKENSSIKESSNTKELCIKENNLCITENTSSIENNNIKSPETMKQDLAALLNFAGENGNNKEKINIAKTEEVPEKKREDSPAPLNFEEISRKPKKVRLLT